MDSAALLIMASKFYSIKHGTLIAFSATLIFCILKWIFLLIAVVQNFGESKPTSNLVQYFLWTEKNFY